MARGIQGKSIAAGLLLAALLAPAQTPEPRQLLEEMAAAEKANRREAAWFVYREDVRYSEQIATGQARRDSRAAYEVTILEGEPYHRKVEYDGRPLRALDQAWEEKRYREVEQYRRQTPLEERRRRYFEAEENRFRIDTGLVLEWHGAAQAREGEFNGRPCWIVETRPRAGAPRPKRRSQWSLSQKLCYWIDKQTLFPVRVVATQLSDFDSSRKGTVTEMVHLSSGGVWLPASITSEGNRKVDGLAVLCRTEQRYSSYRRFTSTSKLLFEPQE